MKRYLDIEKLENDLKERAKRVPGMCCEVRNIECWEGPDVELCEEIFGKENAPLAVQNIIQKHGYGFFGMSLDNYIVEL